MERDRRKKLLNGHESTSRELLGEAAKKNGAEVFSKPRVADVLDINASGFDNELYRYALQAHFDFVVADAETKGLFAVEYDGPGHGKDKRA